MFVVVICCAIAGNSQPQAPSSFRTALCEADNTDEQLYQRFQRGTKPKPSKPKSQTRKGSPKGLVVYFLNVTSAMEPKPLVQKKATKRKKRKVAKTRQAARDNEKRRALQTCRISHLGTWARSQGYQWGRGLGIFNGSCQR